MNRSESGRCPLFLAIVWLAVNAFGAGAFLIVASTSWIEPELAHIPGAGGGAAFVWFFTAVPIFLLVVLLNIGILMWALIIRRKQGWWPISKFLWVSLLIWLIVLVVDKMHH